jgi:hypothetical protein
MAYRNIDSTLDDLQLSGIGIVSHHYDFLHHYAKQIYLFVCDVFRSYDQHMREMLGIEEEEESPIDVDEEGTDEE